MYIIYYLMSYMSSWRSGGISVSWYDAILDFLDFFWDSLKNLTTWLIDAIPTALSAFVSLLWEGFLGIVLGVVSTLNFGQFIVNVSASWGLLNTDAAYLISISGLPEGLSIIGISWGLRWLLNLIPAALTRI